LPDFDNQCLWGEVSARSGVAWSSAGFSLATTRNCSLAQAPRSALRQRSVQNGRQRLWLS